MTDARFLPWARQGLATALTTTDPGGDAPLPLRVPLKVTTAVGGSASGTASVQVHLHGPADVVGIDPRQVRRTDPAPGTAVEPGYLPLIEFQRPDLPWLFTPASANSEDRLRPWLCLVVLEASEVTVQRPDDRPAIARLEHAGRTLPNLAQSWAWAVVQVSGSGAPADALRSARPGQALSRLFCPRLLRPRTSYVALVVPTFEQGRLAGLGRLAGEVASTAQTAPAWRTDTGPLELPVLHSWEFSTGEEGDFEALVTKLRRVALDPGRVGRRPLSVRALPAGLPDLGEVPLAGALEVVSPNEFVGSAASDGLDTPLAPSFTEALRELLNTPLPAPAGTPAPTGLVLPPPLYGHWQAGQPIVPPVGGAAWLRRLNLDPRHRVAAGLGARVVELQQEELMASAWAQAEDVIRANQLLRSAQLARAADRPLHRGLAALDSEALLQITAPVAPRVRHGTRTVSATVQDGGSRVPPAMTGAAFRRALRPRGPLGRRTGVGAADLLRAVNDGTLAVSGPAATPPGTVTFDSVIDGPGLCTRTPDALMNAEPPPKDSPGYQAWLDFRSVALRQQSTMPACHPPLPRPPTRLPTGEIAVSVLNALDPELTVPKRVAGRVSLPSDWHPADPLDPILVSPSFPTPMYRALADLSQDLLLPGVGDIPANCVAGLATNPRFVEAFLVGLNHHVGRLLLARHFPTDQRGTCFRQFWDPASRVPAPTTAAERHDIPALHEWTAASDLGEHLRGGRHFVLLLRGDLLRRYPDAVIYLAQGEWYEAGAGVRPRRRPKSPPPGLSPGAPEHPEKHPLFRGNLAPDVTFIAFPVTPEAAIGDADPARSAPGFFVVIQQQLTELRFGIDSAEPTVLTGSWRDLWWGNVPLTPSGHIDLDQPLRGFGDRTDNPLGLRWGATSAHQAAITTQAPFRAAIHASDLLEPLP